MNDLQPGDVQRILAKEWWARYGTAVIVVFVLVMLGLSGHRFWTSQQEQKAAQASLLYDQYQLALNMHNIEAMKASYNTLMKDYKNTPYATATSLIESSRDVQANELAEATSKLDWVISKGQDYAKPLARLRLAEIKVQEQDFEAALALLENPDPSYQPAYQELTGDVLLAQGKMTEALAQYSLALAGFEAQGFDNILLQYKLQTYGGQ